jgi:hypothetical protein
MAQQRFRVMDSDLHVIEPRSKRKVLWDSRARLYRL